MQDKNPLSNAAGVNLSGTMPGNHFSSRLITKVENNQNACNYQNMFKKVNK